MQYDYRRARPDDIIVGELYLVAKGAQVMPTVIASVHNGDFSYRSLDGAIQGEECYDAMTGIIVSQSGGRLEFLVGPGAYETLVAKPKPAPLRRETNIKKRPAAVP